MPLVRAADSEQDSAIYLTAAFTGLPQGELVALRWRDIDSNGFAIRIRASYTNGHLTTPKSGRARSVPMAPLVAETLARLGQRALFVDDDDLVFPGRAGGHLDGSALSKRYVRTLDRAHLRRLRFHDLRHTFGTPLIAVADIRRVQEWIGHANVQTTMKHLHYTPRKDAALVGRAFAVGSENAARSPNEGAEQLSIQWRRFSVGGRPLFSYQHAYEAGPDPQRVMRVSDAPVPRQIVRYVRRSGLFGRIGRSGCCH